MGDYHSARDILRYLIATQKENGHWFQNQWLGGKAFWQGVQLDEVAFPVLLASALAKHGALDGIPIGDMVRRALSFLARKGPITTQDRWEEDAGINMFTLAVAIAALVEGSALLDAPAKTFALQLADYWNAKLEQWAFVKDTALAHELGVDGYYVRTMPADIFTNAGAPSEIVSIKNLADNPGLPASAQVSTDFLQLVRYGLRRADNPFVLDSVKVVDSLLKTDTPGGPVWHRYNGDGYGEHDDGSAFNGTGRGRAWPLLTGERGHYALSAGDDALPYLKAMASMSGKCGLLPEQVWDEGPVAEHGLTLGKPSGSAMPLVWAHSEFIKLCFSSVLGYPVDRPDATWNRYHGVRPEIGYEIWQYNNVMRRLPAGHALILVLPGAAHVHWGINGWNTVRDSVTEDSGLTVATAELNVRQLSAGDTVQFTFFWLETQTWDGQDYEISIV